MTLKPHLQAAGLLWGWRSVQFRAVCAFQVFKGKHPVYLLFPGTLDGGSTCGDSEASAAQQPPGLIEGFLDCSALVRRPGGSLRHPQENGQSSGGGDEYEAEVLDWEERGIWYTPLDADLDVEGKPFKDFWDRSSLTDAALTWASQFHHKVKSGRSAASGTRCPTPTWMWNITL